MPNGLKSFFRTDPHSLVEMATRDWALKTMALVLAFLLWTVVRAEEPESVPIDDVPVQVDNLDSDWVLRSSPDPASVSIVVSGPSRELIRIAFSRPDVLVPVEQVEDSLVTVDLNPNWVRIFPTPNTRVVEVRPASVQLAFEQVSDRLIPVAVDLTGSPMPGFEVNGPVRLVPEAVRARGARSLVSAVDTIRLPPIDLSGLIGPDTLQVSIDTTGFGFLVSPEQIQVIVPVGSIGETPEQGRGGSGSRP